MLKNGSLFYSLQISIFVRFYNLKDFVRTAWNYYRNIEFAKIDLSLLWSYFWKSPYRMNRELHLEPYGETPLCTMEKIAKIAAITAADTVFELGCGRGRCAFWLAHFKKCKTVAIEYNPLFVARANQLKLHFQKAGDKSLERLSFRLIDMKEADFHEATVLYLYGTLLSEQDIQILAKKMSQLKSGVRIVTISYALDEYLEKSTQGHILVTKEFEVEFCWGKTSAYLQVVV